MQLESDALLLVVWLPKQQKMHRLAIMALVLQTTPWTDSAADTYVKQIHFAERIVFPAVSEQDVDAMERLNIR